MIDYIVWWDTLMGWVTSITTIAFFGLIGIALMAYLVGAKKIAIGCIVTIAFLAIIATYLDQSYGLEIFVPEIYDFFENLFNGGFF
ncbi:MAG: hypothetical protein HWN65_14400 [Candidatus Helarchaeota archaeon]|nr:hypothetical protein [Candidatus Helarchaeota archaeon]